jgi:hypothetical protein
VKVLWVAALSRLVDKLVKREREVVGDVGEVAVLLEQAFLSALIVDRLSQHDE